MKQTIYRNWMQITVVRHDREKQFGFGVLLEPDLRPVYIPPHLVKKFGITIEDVGVEVECLFIVHEGRENLCAVGLAPDGYEILPSFPINGQGDDVIS